ncbi:MAG: hypothetical protein HOE90_11395 [Bacteriovoracaceae bacterium]|nr:hypothetical protein [Bacteriovoracaceae bacterium]
MKKLLSSKLLELKYKILSNPYLPLKKYDSARPYIWNSGLKDIFDEYPNSPDREKTVIVYGLRSYVHHNLSMMEKTFSDCFRFQGANVYNLLCDGGLPSCDMYTFDSIDNQKISCNFCTKSLPFYEKNYPNDYLHFSQYLSSAEKNELKEKIDKLSVDELLEFHYLGVKVSRHSKSSVAKYFADAFREEAPGHIDILRHSSYISCLGALVAKKVFDTKKPTHIFTLHGCYATWGGFCEFMKNNGVEVYVYRKLFNPSMGYFDFPKWTADPQDIQGELAWEKYKHTPLNSKQKKMIDDFFEKKKSGKSDDYLIFFHNKTQNDEKFQNLLEDKGKRKFVLYLHSLWDSGFEEATSPAFKDHNSWVLETIAYFIDHPDIYLIIKPHPQEYSILEENKKGAIALITDKFGKLPENVIFMEKEWSFTSYQLMHFGCISITYYGTVGLESAFFKFPVLFGGFSPIVNAGCAPKVEKKEDYFALIENPQPLYDHHKTHFEIIERYVFFSYFSQAIRVDIYRSDKMYLDQECIDWNKLKDYNKFIKENPDMNRIVKLMLDGKAVINEPEYFN